MQAQARIYRRSKTAMQSGRAGTRDWVLEYDLPTARRPEPLMGWVAADDTLNQILLRFPTRDEAVAYAERRGIPYAVQPEHDRRIEPRNYGDNFRPRAR
jgi:hypothetical protein